MSDSLRDDILSSDINKGDLAPGSAVSELMVDSLTGLPPRTIWEPEMRQHLNFAKRLRSKNVALAMMDLDDFKAINDGPGGHLAGDQILGKLGEALRHEFRESDILGRYGGDEMIVMLTGFKKKDSDESEIDIREKLSSASGAGVSVGIAVWDGSESLEELIHKADIRLYQNKKNKHV